VSTLKRKSTVSFLSILAPPNLSPPDVNARNPRRPEEGAKRTFRRARFTEALVREEFDMKHFLIKYQFKNGSPEEWRQHVAGFISALENAPDLKGKISYRCMKTREGSAYYHLAAASDAEAVSALQSKDFFKLYTEETKRVAGGEVEVLQLEIIAETSFHA
jgi:hypothetical protein